ncbi:MAG: oligosaccharide flippase family protein, partial [Clostridia bacterium]|nr:oligosaccharide flippase family protein [Clostridia bacterium]
GIYTITISIYMLLLTFVTGNISTTVSKNISQNQYNKDFKHKFTTNSIIISLLVGIFIIVFVILGQDLFKAIFTDDMSYTLLLTLLPSILFMAIYSPIMGYFWGKNNYFYVSIIEFVEQVIRIVLSVILIWLNPFNNYMLSACIGLTLACIISSSIGYILYFYKKAKIQFSFSYTKDIIKSTLPLTLMRLVSASIQPIINIIIPMCLLSIGYSNNQALELIGIIFGMCMPIITIPSTIIGSINMAILPDISSNATNFTALNTKIKTNFKLIIICSYIILPIFIVLAEPICEILYSNFSIGYYLCYASILIVPMGINQYFSSIMNALGKEKENFIYSTISSVIILIFIIIFTQYLEILVLPVGLALNSLISSVLCIYKIKKVTHYNHSVLHDIILNSLIILPIIMLDYFIYNIISLMLPSIICVLSICCISIICYITLIIIFQYIDINYIHKLIKT